MNPQPYEPTYEYFNADIAALSSIIATGAAGENFIISAAVFTDLNTTATFLCDSTPAKLLFRFGINIPKTYNLNGSEVLRIWQDTAQGECNIYNEDLYLLIDRLGRRDNISGTSLNYISDIRNLSVNATAPETLKVEISNITAGEDIGFVVGFSSNPFYVDRTAEITEKIYNTNQILLQRNFAGVSTFIDIITAANAAALVTAVNAAISAYPQILTISYAIDPAGGGNSHQALITYK